MVVMDAGIATAANLDWLRSQGFHYLCIDRASCPEPPERDPELEITTSAGHKVEAWRLFEETEGDRQEVQILASSEGRKATDQAILAARRDRFETAIADLHAGLTAPRRTRRHDRVLERVGRIKERYRRVAARYRVTVSRGKGANAVAVSCQRRPAFQHSDAMAGCYRLRSSDTSQDSETLLRQYWMLTDIEATFKSLTSERGLRPVFHQLDRRIASHLMITVIACHVVQLTRLRLQQAGIRLSWWSIRNRLQERMRATVTMEDTDGRTITCRQDIRPGAESIHIARAAGLEVRNFSLWSG